MPQKQNQDLTERYPDIKAGTYKPMCIRDILTKNCCFDARQRFIKTNKTHNDLKFGKEIKMLMVVDTLLLPFKYFVTRTNMCGDYSNMLRGYTLHTLIKKNAISLEVHK